MTHRKKLFVFIFMIILLIITTKIYLQNPVKESITYFPTDPTIKFKKAETILKLNYQEKGSKNYSVSWKESSITENEEYLRQDISFLFINGVLESIMSKWKERAFSIEQSENIRKSESSLFQAITLHHAERHLTNNEIKSKQIMSSKDLYIIDSSFVRLQSFTDPINEEQQKWRKAIDQVVSIQLDYTWNELMNFYNINEDKYDKIPLTKLIRYNQQPLPGLSKEQSAKVLGQLWEGIYKNYLLGIQISSKETIDPIGSKIPLILLSKDKSHLLILIEAKNEEKIRLKQNIS